MKAETENLEKSRMDEATVTGAILGKLETGAAGAEESGLGVGVNLIRFRSAAGFCRRDAKE